MPGVHTWFMRFIDTDRMLVILCNREELDIRAHEGLFTGLLAAAKGKQPEPIISIEDITVPDPDKSGWENCCGKYEHPEDADFIVDKVFMKDDELYAKAIDEDDDELEFRLYPIGENEFGRKGGMIRLTFGKDCVMYNGFTCKKL